MFPLGRTPRPVRAMAATSLCADCRKHRGSDFRPCGLWTVPRVGQTLRVSIPVVWRQRCSSPRLMGVQQADARLVTSRRASSLAQARKAECGGAQLVAGCCEADGRGLGHAGRMRCWSGRRFPDHPRHSWAASGFCFLVSAVIGSTGRPPARFTDRFGLAELSAQTWAYWVLGLGMARGHLIS